MSKLNWAEDGEEEDALALPPSEIIKNANGTESHISYRIREDGKRVKTTRIIKRTVIKTTVNPRVAERRGWAKFGAAAKDPAGPQNDTTTVGEDIRLNPRQGFKNLEREEAGTAASDLEKKKNELKNTTVKCRICNGDHFTARCPFKGTMAPEGEPGLADPVADPMADTGASASGLKSSYVPPPLRKGGAAAAGEKMPGGKYERDDLATLRVTNVGYMKRGAYDRMESLIISTGQRICRGTRTPRYVRTLGSGYESVPCQRSRDGQGEGFRIRELCGSHRCCQGLREDGRFWLQQLDLARRVCCQEGVRDCHGFDVIMALEGLGGGFGLIVCCFALQHYFECMGSCKILI